MNQRLFDECTVRYKDERQRERQKIKEREEAWVALEQAAIANADKSKPSNALDLIHPTGNSQFSSPAPDNEEEEDGIDPTTLADTINNLVS